LGLYAEPGALKKTATQFLNFYTGLRGWVRFINPTVS